jgi:hypothetical protein
LEGKKQETNPIIAFAFCLTAEFVGFDSSPEQKIKAVMKNT